MDLKEFHRLDHQQQDRYLYPLKDNHLLPLLRDRLEQRLDINDSLLGRAYETEVLKKTLMTSVSKG